eukprot:6915002-Heterocapsa_arctica.AAC.1
MIVDRKVNDDAILNKDERIETLMDSIAVAEEDDTMDLEVLKNRLAEKTVSFENLENTMNGIRTENTVHLASIAVFEAARSASEALSCVQCESIIGDETLIEELTRKCSSNDHDRGTLRAELDGMRTRNVNVNGEHPDVITLVDLNKRLLGRCQTVAQESAQRSPRAPTARLAEGLLAVGASPAASAAAASSWRRR